MRYLTVIRHAKSSWDDPGLDDFDRPLNDRGKADIPRMAAWLEAQPQRPQLFLASPACRALTTADLLVTELADTNLRLVTDSRLYNAPEKQLRACLADTDDRITHVALVAHNPGITDLANSLGNLHLDNLPTCGMVQIALAIDHWRDMTTACGTPLAMQWPKRLERDP